MFQPEFDPLGHHEDAFTRMSMEPMTKARSVKESEVDFDVEAKGVGWGGAER